MNLTKRETLPPLQVACGLCDKPIVHWLYREGGRNEPPMVFTARCHGETLSWGIEDVAGFTEVLAKHRGVGVNPFVVFEKARPDVEAQPDTAL